MTLCPLSPADGVWTAAPAHAAFGKVSAAKFNLDFVVRRRFANRLN